MAGRRPVILALTLLVLPELILYASGKPITTMAHGPKGDVEFETLTLSASDFWDGVKTGQRVTISGELLLPKGEGRVPVVVLSHGGGGVGRAEDLWARELRSQGIAVFVVDSFTGRGDRKSTRLNSSHGYISYAVFCLKKKKNISLTTRNHKHHPCTLHIELL